MKFLTNLLTITFCVFFLNSSIAQDNPNYVYTIHLGAFDKAELTDFDDIRMLGYVYSYPLRDDLRQIFLGGYSSRSAAKKVLPQLQQWGYPDAYVMRKAFDEGEEVATVLLATKPAGTDLDYGKYLQAGRIYIVQKNDNVHVLTGQFSTVSVAEKRVAQLKRMGFVDASAITVNTVQLIKVTEFETAGATADPMVAVVDTPKGAAEETEETKEEEIPQGYDILFKKSKSTSKGKAKSKSKSKSKAKTEIPKDIPVTYEETSSRIIVPKKKVKKSSLPKIRVKQKRTSAIELQKVLKSEGTYKGSLDGYYGKGTAGAYEAIKKQNQQVKKYLMLSKLKSEEDASGNKNSRLQKIINNLLEEPTDALELLKSERSELAKVYRAYILFETKGASDEVNQMMNSAIQKTFKGKKLRNTPPFDYNSKYAYDDLTQLLKHLNYIHAASDDAEVPCWIFDQHDSEAVTAFATGGTARIQSCRGDFMDWEETKLLKTIAEDLDPGFGKNKSSDNAGKRALLFNTPKKLSRSEEKDALGWHKSVWTSMDRWANTDPLHDQRVTALKIAYFQSEVRLEDFFMNKGFTYREAKPLAMSVLETIIGTHLINYLSEDNE